MAYEESTQWSDTSENYDVFYGRSFDERGVEETNRLVLREYSRREYNHPTDNLDPLIQDYLQDVADGKRILLKWTPGFYQEGDNYRFFVPFDKETQERILASKNRD